MPFIGAPSPQEEQIFETISDRKTYTGDGIKYIFGVNYYDNHISVFQNGLKLVEGIDYNITASGQFVTFTVPPESGDVIDLIGTVNVTNLAQSSYVRETFIALANQTSIVLSTNIDPTNKINLYYNGIRLAETDFSIAYANNTLTYANPSLADDVIAADVFVPGYRMIDGTLDVTNLTQTSYAREAFENIGNTNTVALSTTIDSSYRTNAYLNGLRLFPDVDYVADYSNNSLNFVNTFANNDVLEVDLYSAGFRILENIDTQITNFSQSSYIKETFVATANQSSVVLATDITSYFKINPYVNGIRLADSDYSLNYTANTINLQGFVLAANDDIMVDMYRPGYRVQGLRLQDLDMPVSVAGQVLHSDGVGGFYFQTPTKHNEYIAAETIYAGNNVSLNDDGTISISKDRWANTQYSLSNTAITIDNPNAYGTSDSDFFGWRVDQSSRYIIAGANLEDEAAGTSSGKAYIFDIKTRQLICTLNNPNAVSTVTGDNFGREVAITEDYAVVSAYLEEHYANFVTSSSSGVVYVFNLASTLTQNSTSTATYTITNPNVYGGYSSDYFGSAIDASSKYIIAGAYFEDSAAGNSSGAAYIFDITDGSLLYTLTNPNLDTTSASDNYGFSVAISDTHAAVSAYVEDETGAINSGKIYVYKISSLASSGIINTPSYVLDNPNAYDTPAYDLFGKQIDITDTHLAAGAYGEDDAGGSNSGKAYIFDVITGTLLHALDNPNAYNTAVSDYFGHSVNLSSRHVIVGAPQEDDSGGTNSGKAYVFDLFTGALLQTLDNPNTFSTSAADDFAYYGLSISENYIVVGAHGELDENVNGGTNSGKVYVYENDYNLNKWIGIASQNIEVGTYGVVNIQGSINNNQSGLTANENYYLGANGALSTVKTNIGVGKALNANTIQLFSLIESDETPLYLRDLIDVKTTATANQVLTADGVGGFYFANTTSSDTLTTLAELTDVNSTATANQVLTADGTGNFYFANTAGGSGSVSLASFTANSTITAGDTVALRIDNGEIEKIAHPIIAQYTEVSQTLSEATTTGTTFFDVDYDENTSSAIVAQRSSVSPFNGLVSIGTVTETSNTTTNGETTREVGFNWGTPVAWNSDNISNTVVAIDTDQNKVVITYINNSDAINIYAVVGDISGNSITFGTPLELYTTRSRFNSIVYDTNSNKMVIYFQDYNSFYMYYAVCTVSGTNITLDSPVTFIVTTASNAYSTALYIPELNKHVLLYHDTSNYVTIMIGELANGTITWGSAVTVQSAAGITPICRYDSVNEKLLLYIGQNTADSNYQSVFIGTITNNSVTFGSAIRVSTANPFSGVANIFVHHKASNKFIIGGADGNNSSYPYYNVVQIDDSAPNGLSISGVTDIVSTGSTYFGLGGGVYASNFEKIFVGIRLDNTTRPNVWTYNPEYTSYDLTTTNATNYIGIAKDSVNNGQVSEVFLVGDIADNQTGLTVNQNYYLTGSGLLTTSSTSYGLIGRAVSDTSIQLLQTVPESLTNLNITDGTSGQVLKTYGNNTFYFADEENLNAIIFSIALG